MLSQRESILIKYCELVLLGATSTQVAVNINTSCQKPSIIKDEILFQEMPVRKISQFKMNTIIIKLEPVPCLFSHLNKNAQSN